VTRVYIPTTLNTLAVAHAIGEFPAPMAAHAVTAAVREWYVEGDLEELEYVALTEAAEGSLRLLAADPTAPRRRVVVSADVPDIELWVHAEDRFRSSVRLTRAVQVEAIASIHVDEDLAASTVVEAIAALPRADDGDADARFLLDEAEATELLWYDVSEMGDLV